MARNKVGDRVTCFIPTQQKGACFRKPWPRRLAKRIFATGSAIFGANHDLSFRSLRPACHRSPTGGAVA